MASFHTQTPFSHWLWAALGNTLQLESRPSLCLVLWDSLPLRALEDGLGQRDSGAVGDASAASRRETGASNFCRLGWAPDHHTPFSRLQVPGQEVSCFQPGPAWRPGAAALQPVLPFFFLLFFPLFYFIFFPEICPWMIVPS